MAPRRGNRSMSSKEILDRGHEIASAVENEIAKVVFGGEIKPLVDVLITALFAGEHVLTRAPIGLAKTLTCSALARAIGGVFRKLQFLPDMLPSDVVGFDMYNPKTQAFEVQHGPLFGANVLLADEINRTTPKAQAALLGPMESRYLTIRSRSYPMEPLFMVLGTRNPMEYEGVYDLPEAQLDRFFAQPVIKEMSEATGLLMLGDKDYSRPAEDRLAKIQVVTSPEEVMAVHETIFATIHVSERLDRYIWGLVAETWKHDLVRYGSSPRGARFLKMAATVSAFRAGREFAEPEDVRRYAVDVLAHRIFLKDELRISKEEQDRSPADVIREVLDDVKPD